MIDLETLVNRDARAGASAMRHTDAADTLAAAIRKPLDALEGAAEEAANGRLGAAKLGLLVAANRLIDALNAVDAEFARQYGPSIGRRPGQQPDGMPEPLSTDGKPSRKNDN
jgi:hypothetical protein